MRGALVLLLVAAPLAVNAAPSGRKAAKARPATTPAPTGDYLPPPTPTAVPISGTAGVAHREGEYGGVTGDAPSDKPAKPKRPPPKGTLTWIGFEAKDGGAEVFFQSVAPFTISQHVEGAALVVHLNLPRLGHNTWRQVDTRFFDNPLSGIVARAVGAARAGKDRPAHAAGIEAKISFKNARDAREAPVRTATEADGMYYAYLTFGEGTEAVKDATAAPVTSPTLDTPEVEAPARPTRPQAQEGDQEAPPDSKH